MTKGLGGKKAMHRHPVFPTGGFLLVFLTCSKSLDFFWLVQSQQNDYFDYDLFKVSKMT